jgi:ankyrin repeat protein
LYLHEQKEYDTRTFNIIGLAAHHESPECLQVMLDFGADVNNHERVNGVSPLMRAAGFGRVECLHLLIEKNADVGCKSEGGSTGIFLAAFKGHPECVKILIEAKADVNQPGQFGFTGAHVACEKGNVDCLRLLIETRPTSTARAWMVTQDSWWPHAKATLGALG